MSPAALKAWRHAMGWSQREAAAHLGLHRVTLARYETGAIPLPPKLLELACRKLAEGKEPAQMTIHDTLTANLRDVARELLDARDDRETTEAMRAFLAACRNFGVAVDDAGELTRAVAILLLYCRRVGAGRRLGAGAVNERIERAIEILVQIRMTIQLFTRAR